jgi:hypothetical protein
MLDRLELELRRCGIEAQLLRVDFKRQTLVLVTGTYADFLIARSLLSKRGWDARAP